MDHKGMLFCVVIALAVLCGFSDGAQSHFGSGAMAWPWHTWTPGVRGWFGPRSYWSTQADASPWVNKRSVSTTGNRFKIMTDIDQCHFDAYNIDGDDVITLAEMRIVLFDDETADDVFKALDLTTADGRVTKDEFKYMAPRVIEHCQTANL